MAQIFNLFLYQPIYNLLVFFYNIIPGHDIGLAIVVLTIVIKLILYPLSLQSIKSQRVLGQIQPKLKEIQTRYKDNQQEKARAMMELYKKEKINPASSCLPLLIQFPFLIAVFQVFRDGLKRESLKLLYPFIHNPGVLNPISFNLVDLAKPNLVLAILAGLSQFWQTKMMITKKQPQVTGSRDENMMAAMNKQMLYFMPILTVVFAATLPSGLALYWLLTTLLTIGQQYWIFRKEAVPISEVGKN